ncbi:MAG: retention module-containing protein, partial [Rhodocyclales bacterium]|nr:retention module-containing protein [Rhodocyclales bacterium]
MANAVGKVALLEGQAFARGQDGSQRALKVGDVVMEGEVIVTGAGSRVELAFEGGQSFLLREKETVTLDKSVLGIDLPEGHDAALLDRISETAAITRAIAEGSSLDELLEETAAGLDGGSGEDGHNFVQLLRIVEGVPPLASDYGTARGYVPPELVGDGGRPDVLEEEPAPAAPVAPPAPVGNVPVAVADNFSLNEDATLNSTLATNDTPSADGGNTWSLAGNASHGVVTVNADGSFSYTPAANYNGPDSFSYTITDADGSSSTATVTLAVNSQNDVPVAINDNFSLNEDAIYTGTLA